MKKYKNNDTDYIPLFYNCYSSKKGTYWFGTIKEVKDAFNKLPVLRCKKCGHTIRVNKRITRFCYMCGNRIYNDKKEEFKDLLKKEMKK